MHDAFGDAVLSSSSVIIKIGWLDSREPEFSSRAKASHCSRRTAHRKLGTVVLSLELVKLG